VDWLGEEKEALIGRSFASLFAKNERTVADKFWQKPNCDQSEILTLTPANPQCSPRSVELRSASTNPSEESWIIVSIRDLGSSQPTGPSGPEEQESIRIPIRSLRDGLVVLSKRGEILFSNPAITEMFEPNELPKVCREWMTSFAEHDQVGILGFSSPYEGQTLEYSSNDGRTFLLTRSFLFEPKGPASVMIVAKDITELRILQQKGHQLEMELLRESKLAEFGAMAAGIAHNLNGPLTSILGSCELMAMTQGKTPDTERIRAQATVMKDIIETLVRKCRQEQNPEPQEISVIELIETEWKFLHANLFFKHDVEKRLELDPVAPKIWVVYADLSQAIGNLLRNAIDALFDRDERRIIVRTRHNDRFLFIDIEDTGTGIKQEDMPKLFKPFYTTKPVVGKGMPGQPTGTGLGLSMSRSILARYGAEILVESEWEKGSIFTIRFPLAHTEPSSFMKL
jgi:signal transduction histidine kinase